MWKTNEEYNNDYKGMGYVVDSDTNCDSALGTDPKWLESGQEDLNSENNQDYSDYSIVKIGQNTEEIPGDMRNLVVSQAPMKYH